MALPSRPQRGNTAPAQHWQRRDLIDNTGSGPQAFRLLVVLP